MSDPSGAPHADAATCVEQWAQLREAKPLVQCITNFVSMDLMANCLLAAGASPAMVSHQACKQANRRMPLCFG